MSQSDTEAFNFCIADGRAYVPLYAASGSMAVVDLASLTPLPAVNIGSFAMGCEVVDHTLYVSDDTVGLSLHAFDTLTGEARGTIGLPDSGRREMTRTELGRLLRASHGETP